MDGGSAKSILISYPGVPDDINFESGGAHDEMFQSRDHGVEVPGCWVDVDVDLPSDSRRSAQFADPDHIREWKRNANLVVLWISGGTSDRVRDAQAAQLLVEGVTNSAPGTIRVGAARSADPSIPAPNVFGVDGLTATLADDLIRRPVLSTSEITFFAFSPDPPISPFMGIVQGLTYPNTRAGGQDAAAAILQNVSENPRLTQLLLSHRDALPPVWTVDQVLRYVFGSLAVTAMELDAGGGASRTVWRVFMAPTTENVKFHDAIRTAFAEISFATTWNNTGEVRADMECRVCPSIDHPSGLCPFPLVPGWMGGEVAADARAAVDVVTTEGTEAGDLVPTAVAVVAAAVVSFEFSSTCYTLPYVASKIEEDIACKRLKLFTTLDPDHPNSAGVTLVLNKDITNIEGVETWEIIPGRALLAKIPWYGEITLTVLAIYAPSGDMKLNKEFWDELTRIWTTQNLPVPDTVLGDMNIVEDAIDRLPHHLDDEAAVSALANFKYLLGLKDGWRMMNPDEKVYTYTHNNGAHSRIDRANTTV
ncbi:hypothetical protein K438DRAFT_1960920 [Mycena galopus ATCC 62051]|nr:hypothetical protein K438DRAFT_1960920 [Mycena galopus ATCC 62051]